MTRPADSDHVHRMPYFPKFLGRHINRGNKGLIFTYICADCEQEVVAQIPPINLGVEQPNAKKVKGEG